MNSWTRAVERGKSCHGYWACGFEEWQGAYTSASSSSECGGRSALETWYVYQRGLLNWSFRTFDFCTTRAAATINLCVHINCSWRRSWSSKLRRLQHWPTFQTNGVYIMPSKTINSGAICLLLKFGNSLHPLDLVILVKAATCMVLRCYDIILMHGNSPLMLPKGVFFPYS